jgi:hypothetical protein
MSVDAKQDIKVFRAALFPAFIAIAGPALGIVLGFVVQLDGWRHLDARSLLTAVVAVASAGFASAWVVSVCFPTKLGPSGVQGHSFWGAPRLIRWGDIHRAVSFHYLTLKFLRLFPSDGTAPTWIALSQARRREFEEEIRKLAPPESPIRAFLS